MAFGGPQTIVLYTFFAPLEPPFAPITMTSPPAHPTTKKEVQYLAGLFGFWWRYIPQLRVLTQHVKHGMWKTATFELGLWQKRGLYRRSRLWCKLYCCLGNTICLSLWIWSCQWWQKMQCGDDGEPKGDSHKFEGVLSGLTRESEGLLNGAH